MTNAQVPEAAGVPQWDLADRLRKALREADIEVQDMASYLEVGRNTVSNYLAGRTRPGGGALRQWALRCGVSYTWLRDGIETHGNGPVNGESGFACTSWGIPATVFTLRQSAAA